MSTTVMSTNTTVSELLRSAPMFTWTVEQLHAMTEAGILRDGEPVELIDGLLIRKDRADRGGTIMNHGVRHATGVVRGPRAIEKVIRDLQIHLRIHLPVTLSDRDEPEPDYCLVRGTPEDFTESHPTAADLLLVAEVSDISLAFDRTTKLAMYAAAGVAVYWIVNLVGNCVEVFEEPDPARREYRRRSARNRGETVALPLPAGACCDISVDSLLVP